MLLSTKKCYPGVQGEGGRGGIHRVHQLVSKATAGSQGVRFQKATEDLLGGVVRKKGEEFGFRLLARCGQIPSVEF